MASVAVLGSGSWGTALAMHLARLGNDVTLWARNAQTVASLRAAGEHTACHPGFPFPESLTASDDLEQACRTADAVVVVVPVARGAGSRRADPADAAAWGARGVDVEGRRAGHARHDVRRSGGRAAGARDPRVVLSGPSFAREVGSGLADRRHGCRAVPPVAEELQRLFSGPTFRVYTSTDVVGVEIGGAVKNVIAVAAGVSDGLGFGHNTRAALITRGLAEISRLAHQSRREPGDALRPVVPGRPGPDLHG